MVNSNIRLIRLPEVKSKVGLGRTTIFELIKKNEFPKPHKIGVRAVAWDSQSISEWIESRMNGKAA